MVFSDVLNILACPACKGELRPANEQRRLYCYTCGLEFPVREGIPVMLLDEATRIEKQDLADREQ